MPNGLLARYFHARGQLLDLDLAAIDEAQPEPLFEVWLALPETPRHGMDVEFREIFGLSCEKGFGRFSTRPSGTSCSTPARRSSRSFRRCPIISSGR